MYLTSLAPFNVRCIDFAVHPSKEKSTNAWARVIWVTLPNEKCFACRWEEIHRSANNNSHIPMREKVQVFRILAREFNLNSFNNQWYTKAVTILPKSQINTAGKVFLSWMVLKPLPAQMWNFVAVQQQNI